MEDLRRTAFLSPVVTRGVRKPFGEITTNTPPPKPTTPMTPAAATASSSTPNEEAALTPMANLKLLMKVAASAAETRPSRRELFRDENDENSENNCNNINRRLVIDDHDYGNNIAASIGPLLPRNFSLGQSESSSAVAVATELACNNDSGNSSSCSVQTPTSSISSLSLISPITSSAPNSAASSIGGSSIVKISRKDKSLGLLCDKFISRFPREVPPSERCEIPLDDLAKQMSTERRRIYDIVNVLEAVQMMTKIGKNLYQWHGVTHQIKTLAWLKQLAEKLNMQQRYLDVKQIEAAYEESSAGDRDSLLYGSSPCNGQSPMTGGGGDLKRSPQLTGESPRPNSSFSSNCSVSSASPSPIERKTSLGVACQKFIMLFLIAQEPNAKINLDFAARVIHGIGLPEAIMKTRIRRLYDIANILQSLKLIKKVTITEAHGGRKPAFTYTGPDLSGIEVNKDDLQTLPSTRQRNSLITFGKNLHDLPDIDPNDVVVPSAPLNNKDTANIANPTIMMTSSLSMLPPKKRPTPEGGFGISRLGFGSDKRRQLITLERARSCNDVALNLTKPKQRDDQQLQRSDFNFAIPRLSASVDLKRTQTAPLLELNSQQPMARHSPQPNFGVSLLKRQPLHLQHQQQPQDHPMELTARPPKQVMKLVGFGAGGNSAISSPRSHETSSVAAAANSRTYIAISRPVIPAAAASAAAVSVAKVPHTLYRAATL